MSTARFLVGDVFDRMAELPDGSVDCLITSPPFYCLRSYLPSSHPDKHLEIGSEATPAAFLSTLLRLTREWRRLLAPHGSICVELGDTHSDGGPGWPLSKSLCGIPDAYHLSLIYGRNILDPTEQFEPWRVRNKIVWHRPNPPVGALGDKVRPSTSYITVACVSKERWFDLDSERTAHKDPADADRPRIGVRNEIRAAVGLSSLSPATGSNPAGAPLLDCWTIPTQPYSGAHYATFPQELPKRLINLMCPLQVCLVCGEPRRRIVDPFTLDAYRQSDRPQTRRAVALADQHGLTDEHIAAIRAFGTSDAGKAQTINNGAGKNSERVKVLAGEAKDVLGGYFREFVMNTNAATGSTWTDCGHDAWRRGHVLDPFAGSGTTLAVATGLGRDATGIDIDARNLDLARERIGMFLTEDEVVA